MRRGRVTESAIVFQKQRAAIRVTEETIQIIQNGETKCEVPFTDVQGFQRAKWKGGEPTEKSVTKLRINRYSGSPIEVSFTGVQCLIKLDAVLAELKSGQKRATSQEKDEDHAQQTEPHQKHNPLLDNLVKSLAKDGLLSKHEILVTLEGEPIDDAIDKIKRVIRDHPEIEQTWKQWVNDHRDPQSPDGISVADARVFWEKYEESVRCNPQPLERLEDPTSTDRSIFTRYEGTHERKEFEGAQGVRRPLTLIPVEEVPDALAVEAPAPPKLLEAARRLNMISEQVMLDLESMADDEGLGPEEEEPEPSPCQVPRKRAELNRQEGDINACSREMLSVLDEYMANFNEIRLDVSVNAEDVPGLVSDITTGAMKESDLGGLAGTAVVSGAMKTIRKHKLEQQILLYHFWANFESSGKENRDKAAKLKDKLKELKEMMDREKANFRNPKIARYMIPLYEEMDEAFEKVFERYQ